MTHKATNGVNIEWTYSNDAAGYTENGVTYYPHYRSVTEAIKAFTEEYPYRIITAALEKSDSW